MPIKATVDGDTWFCHQGYKCSGTSYNDTSVSRDQYELRHTRYYGVGEGDESGDLCPLMLQVVLDLFDGVDYEDP